MKDEIEDLLVSIIQAAHELKEHPELCDEPTLRRVDAELWDLREMILD